jgi:hypothetical protein
LPFFERWLAPENFDAEGRQRMRLSELTAAAHRSEPAPERRISEAPSVAQEPKVRGLSSCRRRPAGDVPGLTDECATATRSFHATFSMTPRAARQNDYRKTSKSYHQLGHVGGSANRAKPHAG